MLQSQELYCIPVLTQLLVHFLVLIQMIFQNYTKIHLTSKSTPIHGGQQQGAQANLHAHTHTHKKAHTHS